MEDNVIFGEELQTFDYALSVGKIDWILFACLANNCIGTSRA
jgi:hypothetical protein